MSKTIFVSDLFTEDYIGGAELTSDAIIDRSNRDVFKLRSNHLNDSIIESNLDACWIFGNFSFLNKETIFKFIKLKLNYHILEYDFKYCSFRSSQKHIKATGQCNCETEMNGKVVSLFMNNAKSLWFMSEKQKQIYCDLFPFLQKDTTTVLSSVFAKKTLEKISQLPTKKNENYIIFDSNNWLKGTKKSIEYAVENNLNYELVKDLPYDKMLEKLSFSKGLIFLPQAYDTCPRITIEAKLLDCELVLGDNVLHRNEDWFKCSKESVMNHLSINAEKFWSFIDDQ
jgi:hypothetical protein